MHEEPLRQEVQVQGVIAAIEGEKQLSELAAEFKGHKNDQDPVAVSEELVKTIGHQTIQIGWLKRKLGISESRRG